MIKNTIFVYIKMYKENGFFFFYKEDSKLYVYDNYRLEIYIIFCLQMCHI